MTKQIFSTKTKLKIADFLGEYTEDSFWVLLCSWKQKKTKPSFNPEGWISYNFLTATLSCWEIWDRWSERESCSQRLLLSKSFTSLSTHILKPKSTSMGTPDRKTPTVCGKGTVLPHQSRDDPLSLELKSYYYGEAWPKPPKQRHMYSRFISSVFYTSILYCEL